jgi:hypothetical protein
MICIVQMRSISAGCLRDFPISILTFQLQLLPSAHVAQRGIIAGYLHYHIHRQGLLLDQITSVSRLLPKNNQRMEP